MTVILDIEAIKEEAKYDGYYAVTTNLDIDIQEIIHINKQHWMIEDCFRAMKTDFEASSKRRLNQRALSILTPL